MSRFQRVLTPFEARERILRLAMVHLNRKGGLNFPETEELCELIIQYFPRERELEPEVEGHHRRLAKLRKGNDR